mgnify:CR=1 FL=1
MLKLMIVEDEEIIREGLRECLDWRKLGCEIAAEAEDGAEALAKARMYAPDIVLTDIVMAGMNGLDFIARLREERPDPPPQVILISAHENVAYMKSAFKLDAVDYLLKPFDLGELEQAVRKAAARCRADRAEAQPDMPPWEEGPDEEDTGARRTVRLIRELIRKRYAEDLTLPDIAKEVYLSPNYMAAMFKKETGETVNDYMTRVRIERAKRLLLDPALSVTDVADAVGYRDSNYFSKLFKKMTGYSPKEYRESRA